MLQKKYSEANQPRRLGGCFAELLRVNQLNSYSNPAQPTRKQRQGKKAIHHTLVGKDDRAVEKRQAISIPVYVQFCPLANNNRGAYRLSTKEQIKNSYYGDIMVTCNELREVTK